MYKSFLIKYAEIAIIGKNRYLFEDALVSQINHALKKAEGEFLVRVHLINVCNDFLCKFVKSFVFQQYNRADPDDTKHTLEDRKIYVSAGSACSQNKPSVSNTLTNIGLKGSLLDSTIRFSFSVHTTEEEIDYALEVMNEVVPKLRRYTRKQSGNCETHESVK